MINTLILFERLTFGGQQSFMLNVLQRTKSFNIYTGFFVDGPMREDFDKISKKTFKIDPDNMDLKYYIKRPYSFLKVLISLRRIVKKEKIDFLITNGFFTYFFGCLVKLIVKVKVVRFIGADLVRNEPFHFVKRFNSFPLHKLTNLFFGYEDILYQMEKKGVSKNKLAFRLGNMQAVDTTMFFPFENDITQDLIKKYNLQKEENIIISWHGRIHYDKEIFHTIEMLKVLKSKNFEQFKFLIVGDGASINDVKSELSKNNLLHHTIFAGIQPFNTINNFFNITDIEVLLDFDPIGGSHIREAMACGRIVITTNGKTRFQETWIEHSKTGFLVSPENMYAETADIIISLHKNRPLIHEIGKNGAEYAKRNLSFENVAAIFESECITKLNL